MVLMLARQAAWARALCAGSAALASRIRALSLRALFASSSVVRVQDAAEPYTVEISIQLRGAPEEGEARARVRFRSLTQRPVLTCSLFGSQDTPPVYASGVGVFHKIGAVRSLNT